MTGIRFSIKVFRQFLYNVPFVLKTDHQPLVYLHRMEIMDSRLARTYEDLAEFEYQIEYIPGEQNKMADLMSRLPPKLIECKIRSGEEEKFLPQGLRMGKQTLGAGLSMFESVLQGLKHIKAKQNHTVLEEENIRNLKGEHQNIPLTPEMLRNEVMEEAIKRPELLGFPKSKEYVRMLQQMKAGQTPYQEVLMIVSYLYLIIIQVHYGDHKPVFYRYQVYRKSNRVMHLQCLGGTHYNWIEEERDHHRAVEMEKHQKEEIDQKIEVLVGLHGLFGKEEEGGLSDCNNYTYGALCARILVENKTKCALIDSGAQISLIKRSVLKDLTRYESSPTQLNIKGISKGTTHAMEKVWLDFKFESGASYQHSFVVLENESMPYCFLIGIDFMKAYGLSLDVDEEIMLKQGKMVVKLTHGKNYPDFYGQIILEKTDNQEVLSDEDILEMQEMSFEIQTLKKNLKLKRIVDKWPEEIKDFKKYAEKFVIVFDTVYFFNGGEEEAELSMIPVLPMTGIIGITAIIHSEQLAHIGKHKLWQVMKSTVFHPRLRKIVEDIATTCETCQKYKIQSPVTRPPLRKITTNEPFEMIVIDCVSLPRTTKGHIGLIIIVDHKSKFTYAVPFKNKTSENIASIIQQQLLPMMITKPRKCLSDNGPEFVGKPFRQMLAENGISHIYITPYMSSSNGLAERTIRTLSELLRTLGQNGFEWEENLPKALWCYNSTKHSAHGMSPRNFLLQFEKSISENNQMAPKEQEYWREGNEGFRSFNIGDLVIKERNEIGQRTENKLKEKFIGPFKVTQRWDNDVTYMIERKVNGQTESIRAHQKQLRKWREPPVYLRNHPVYQLCIKENQKAYKKYMRKEEPLTDKTIQIIMKKKMRSKSSQTERKEWNLPLSSVHIRSKSDMEEMVEENPENNHCFIDDEIHDVSTPFREEENVVGLGGPLKKVEQNALIMQVQDVGDYPLENIYPLIEERFPPASSPKIYYQLTENTVKSIADEDEFEGFLELDFEGFEKDSEILSETTGEQRKSEGRNDTGSSTNSVKNLISLFSSIPVKGKIQDRTVKHATRSSTTVQPQAWVLANPIERKVRKLNRDRVNRKDVEFHD